jgi:hypothetical protein
MGVNTLRPLSVLQGAGFIKKKKNRKTKQNKTNRADGAVQIHVHMKLSNLKQCEMSNKKEENDSWSRK